jgi:tRNA pseudouridine13 synthase
MNNTMSDNPVADNQGRRQQNQQPFDDAEGMFAIQLTRAYPSTDIIADIKSIPEDFIVDEIIDIDFSGEGEHCWLRIRKTGCNTDWLASQIAYFCNIKRYAVSYAGLKDRNAVTTQWFSVHLPGKPDPDWDAFEAGFNVKSDQESIRIIESARHIRKLQRGALRGNRFELVLRNVRFKTVNHDQAALDTILGERCKLIAQRGVPNYFGEQRFGHDRNNLFRAMQMFAGRLRRLSRNKRSLYLSAARSWLFNRILNARVLANNWDHRINGDVFILDGRRACFADDGDVETIEQRLQAHEIHPAIVMWGEKDELVSGDAAAIENEVISGFPVYRQGLIDARVEAGRRASRVIPADMWFERDAEVFRLGFTLPSGSFATVVLDEILSTIDCSLPQKD